MRRIIAAILALTALMGLAAVFSSTALADGDPASDVLSVQPVFHPSDSGASPQEAADLQAAVQAATRAGFPIRVALIGSSADLGTVTQLWQDPRDYGVYLGKELSLEYHGALLVVMPQGQTLNVLNNQITKGDSTVMENVGLPGPDLAASAEQTVIALAKASGHAINVPSVRVPAAAGSGISAPALIALVAGLVLIVVAWALSLRLRPPARKRALA